MVEVTTLLDKLMMIAKLDRARFKYSEEEAFMPKVMIIGPNDESCVTPANWRNEQEKYAMMRAATEAARRLFAQAIVVVSDTRWIMSDVFCEHFKVEPPNGTREGFDAYQKHYLAILHKHGGEMKNLPRQLWQEAVTVAIKGPRCGAHVRMAPYDCGPGDKVHYLPPEPREGEQRIQMNLIPEWWH
jgi:hypothetical protein